MKKHTLITLWGVLFILCAGLGFLPQPAGVLRGLLTGAALAFFVPPAMLLYRAGRERDRRTLKLARNLSLLSLGLSLVFLVLNLLSALWSEWLGAVLYNMLVIVSTPMVCSGYWVGSLFLWACLLMVSLSQLKKARAE